MRSDRSPCPKCGARDVIPVIHGLPDDELAAAAARNEVSLVGCCFSADDPAWHCRACGNEFGRQWPALVGEYEEEEEYEEEDEGES